LAAEAAGPLDRALRAVDAVGLAAAWVAAACLAGLTLLLAGEIATRTLSNLHPAFPATIPVAWEYSAYLMGAAFIFGAAATLRAGGHIRVNVLLAALPPAGLRIVETVATAFGLFASGFLAWSLVWFAVSSFERGQTSIASATPLWPAKAAIALGACVLTLQMAARLARVIAGRRADLPAPAVAASEG
jgi:TRAP-type C4-dicarboxylate transport system permease small subunit